MFHIHPLTTLAFIFLFLKITPTSTTEDNKPSSFGGSHAAFRAETHLRFFLHFCRQFSIWENKSYRNLALEDKQWISRHRSRSHNKEKPASSKGVSYLADSQWANIESVESVKPYPGEAETYPGEAEKYPGEAEMFPGKAETKSQNERSNLASHYNENVPGIMLQSKWKTPCIMLQSNWNAWYNVTM